MESFIYPINATTDFAEIRYARPPEIVGYFQFSAILVHKDIAVCVNL
jgi:hypothetical protein